MRFQLCYAELPEAIECTQLSLSDGGGMPIGILQSLNHLGGRCSDTLVWLLWQILSA